MAETTFNRELGAAPAGITRFGQILPLNTLAEPDRLRRKVLIKEESIEIG